MSVSEIHRTAALDNAALCAAMWRAHGLGVERVNGCVACSGTPPRFYPNVVTVDPTIYAQDQMRSVAERAERASGAFFVKDSYRALALGSFDFEPLFDARWIHRPAGLDSGPTRLDWRPVTDATELSAWEAAWSGSADEPPLFLPSFLTEPGVTMLAGWADSAIVAGCIIMATGAVAGLSNVFGDASETIRVAAKIFPGCDLVGYENGEALATALKSGFETVGDLVVWRRP
ncbi:MAG TPA: hypothetical protein VGG92_17010 [Caulobacteraceae bacterium]